MDEQIQSQLLGDQIIKSHWRFVAQIHRGIKRRLVKANPDSRVINNTGYKASELDNMKLQSWIQHTPFSSFSAPAKSPLTCRTNAASRCKAARSQDAPYQYVAHGLETSQWRHGQHALLQQFGTCLLASFVQLLSRPSACVQLYSDACAHCGQTNQSADEMMPVSTRLHHLPFSLPTRRWSATDCFWFITIAVLTASDLKMIAARCGTQL